MKRAVRRKFYNIIVIACFSISCSTGTNAFNEMANLTKDEVLLQDIQIKVNAKNYTGAITVCTSLGATFAAERDPNFWCASAYAGSCGLEMLDMVNDLVGYVAPEDIMFFLMKRQDATAALIADCDTAAGMLRSVGDETVRTANENALLVLIALHKLGLISHFVADTNDDDAIDGGFDSCTDFTDAQARSIGDAFLDIAASGTLSNIPDADTLETAIELVCAAFDVADNTKDFCDAADGAAMTAAHLQGVRALMSEDAADFGLADCGGGNDAVTCAAAYSTCI